VGLFVLTLINLLNYLDRFVVSALVESLKASEFKPTDAELGMLMTGFIMVYMAAAPVFGILGDRFARPRLMAAGVAVWSAATALAGFANSFFHLFLARAAVGIGEAAYATISPSILADWFPKDRRGRVFAVFFCAIPVGSALGYIVGGLVDQHFGWRMAFFVAGIPGLLLAVLCLRLKDPPRGGQDGDSPTLLARAPGVVQTYRDLFGNRPYLFTVLGYAAYTFAVGGMAFWMPAFLERARGIPREQATVTFGAIVVFTGFAGTFAGGWLGDRLLKWNSEAYLWLSGVVTLLAVPASIAALMVPDRAVYVPAIVVAELLLFASTGPVNSAIVNLVAPGERATAVALSTFAIHVLGDVPSPPLIGKLSDIGSLPTALMVVPAAIAAGGVLWLLAARSASRRTAEKPSSPSLSGT
jgi:MFS family permease